MALHLLGIRHHGPGSARHVKAFLENNPPDIILIEGPPEGEFLLHWVNHPDMQPPVALLAYVPDAPQQAVFYPFATFSPEWQAMAFGQAQQVPVRFIDMPLKHTLAPAEETIAASDVSAAEASEEAKETEFKLPPLRNPIAHLANIAGYDDAEAWWENHFETALHPDEVFAVLTDAMASLREALPPEDDPTEARREAFMREGIRKAQKEGYANIAVICGAWHAPALRDLTRAKEDKALLKNLPKVKIECTWIPWTFERLSLQSGYGAGITSPGWYQHCWQFPRDEGTRWLSQVARVFREKGQDISSAHIIEAVRLAQSLCGLRQRPRPGLSELNEAVQTVMCMGDSFPMLLLQKNLITGQVMGQVPAEAPQDPLTRDFQQQCKSLRLDMNANGLKLDLREAFDLRKSVFLHRLRVLDIHWGRPVGGQGKGTFKEEWALAWQPEMMIALAEKANRGNTVAAAANVYLQELATHTTSLATVSERLQMALPAELPEGTQALITRLDQLASDTADTERLMEAFLPLVELKKYGNVRNTDQELIAFILHSIFYRMLTGLPLAAQGIDPAQALQLSDKIRQVHQGILRLDEPVYRQDWLQTLAKTRETQGTAPGVDGLACKILYDQQYYDAPTTAREFSQMLSQASDPAIVSAWLEGFLKDAATLIILDEAIWQLLNEWVKGLEDSHFIQVLPLLRRTFSPYSPAEKSKIASRAAQKKVGPGPIAPLTKLDPERAAQMLPVLEMLLGLS